jgi:hypothetical protein
MAQTIPAGAIATESMSSRPRHGSEWRSRQPSALQRCERALDVLFGARSDAAAASERKPMPRRQPESGGDDDQTTGDERPAEARGLETEQPECDGADRGLVGAGQAAVLLPPRMVHVPAMFKEPET